MAQLEYLSKVSQFVERIVVAPTEAGKYDLLVKWGGWNEEEVRLGNHLSQYAKMFKEW